MWKDINVVMLATNKKANIILSKDKKVLVFDKSTVELGGYTPDEVFTPQQIYFLSDEEIKEGDWCYNSISNGLEKWSYKGWIEAPDFEYLGYKKVIATTDTSLGLPQPSQLSIEKFIEEYNKGNQITEVLVEVDHCDGRGVDINKLCELVDCKLCNGFIKINSDNNIHIKSIKDSWSREEHISDIQKICKLLYFSANRDIDFSTEEELSKWVYENL